MTSSFPPRSFTALAAVVGCAAALAFGITGCQSDQQQRIAEARELLRQKQTLQTSSGNLAPTVPAAPAPAVPAPAGKVAGTDDLGMPLYPGAKKVNMGPGDAAGLGDGLSMALLETHDPVDAVISFYDQKLRVPGSKVPPNRTEDRLDGHRVVRLSAPRDDGGLQTVEARDEAGKTTVQLMNMKGTPGAVIPPRIPGMPASGAAGGSSPRDLTAPLHPPTGDSR